MSQKLKNTILAIVAMIQALCVAVGGFVQDQMTTQAAIAAGVSAIIAFIAGVYRSVPGTTPPSETPPQP